MIQSVFLPRAEAYLRSIRNANKKSYARSYLDHMLSHPADCPLRESRANASYAQRLSDQPLRPKHDQRLSCEDLPLFGDTHKQLEMF